MADELNPGGAAVAKNEPPAGSNAAGADAGGGAAGAQPQPNPAASGSEGQPAPAATPDSAADKGAAKPERDPLLPEKLEAETEGGEQGEGGEGDPDGKELPEGAVDIDGVPMVLPEGISADNEEFRAVVGMMKGLNVPQEAMQKLTDYHVNHTRGIMGKLEEADGRLRENLNKRWTRECNTDPEFGGKNFDASCNYVQAALRKYFTEEELYATEEKDGFMGFLEFRDKANLRNHPLLFRLLARAGRDSMGAVPISSDAPPPQREDDLAERMFPQFSKAAK